MRAYQWRRYGANWRFAIWAWETMSRLFGFFRTLRSEILKPVRFTITKWFWLTSAMCICTGETISQQSGTTAKRKPWPARYEIPYRSRSGPTTSILPMRRFGNPWMPSTPGEHDSKLRLCSAVDRGRAGRGGPYQRAAQTHVQHAQREVAASAWLRRRAIS